MSTLTPTADLLAAFEAASDFTSYWRAFVAVESRLNYFYNNGMFDEHFALQPEFSRINQIVAPKIEAMITRPSSTPQTSSKAA